MSTIATKLTLAALALAATAFAQPQSGKPRQSFENLKEAKAGGFTVKYEPSISTLIMKKFKDLDSDYSKTFPDYKDYKNDDCNGENVLMLKTKISSSVNKHYYVAYDGCSGNGDYLNIYEEGNENAIRLFFGADLVISGGGSVYSKVLLTEFSEKGPGLYLARTSFGLVGWVNVTGCDFEIERIEWCAG
jgi:hypothetical protein